MSTTDVGLYPMSPTSTPKSYRRIPTPFTPSRTSPLTPKHQNHHDSLSHVPFLPSQPLSPPQSPTSLLKFAEIKRTHKPVPIVRTREDASERRRQLFMRKVANGREDQRMEARYGEDELIRMVLVSEKRRWMSQLARAARSMEIPTIEEETELELAQSQEQMSIEEALIRDQDAELEAILEQLDLQDHEIVDVHPISPSQPTIFSQHQQIQCRGCGEDNTIVTILTGERFCACCGWSPP